MDKKLKVVVIGLLPVNLKEVKGGIVALIMNLFSGFERRNDIEVTHISFNDDITEPKVVNYAHNVAIHYVPFKVKLTLLDYLINRKALKDILEAKQPDIIHIEEVTPHLLRFIHYPKERIVVTQNGIMAEEFKLKVGGFNKLKALFKVYVEKYVFPLYKNMIFVSDYNKRLFPKTPALSSNIFNPVNSMFFTPVSASGKINSLIYVGEINKRKNLKIVLEALGILKKEGIIFKLNVAGGYREESYKQVITELVDEKGIQDQLVFHGWMTQQQIFSLLEESSIFVLPSLQETLPLSIGEAMARGKVVVASNVGGIAEMFTDKTSGFIFERDNLEQLVVLLRNLYNNQNLIDSVSKQARIDADGKFAADLVAAQTINFYRQVISKAIGNKLK